MCSLLRVRTFNNPDDSSKNTVSGRLDHRVCWISGFSSYWRPSAHQLHVLGRGTGSRSWSKKPKPSTDLPCWSPVWITAVFNLHHRKRADLCRLLEIKREKHWSPILCYIIFIRIYLVPSAWFLINLFAYWARKMQTDFKNSIKYHSASNCNFDFKNLKKSEERNPSTHSPSNNNEFATLL